MSSESALTFASLLLTYLLRTTAVYLLLSLLSRSTRNAHVRFWLHGLFLAGIATDWLYLLLSLELPVLRWPGSTAPGMVSAGHLSWSLNPALLPDLVKGFSAARWCYAIIFFLLLIRFCGRFWQLRNFLRASQPSPCGLSFLFELVRSDSDAPPCELRLAEALRSPATTGWWRPKVLLPRELLHRFDAKHLVHVFRHELIHVRRRDYLWDGLSTLGCYLIFFHPAAWLARRCLRWERELVCDEGVVQTSRESRLEYASCLTTLANWWFLEEEAAGRVDFLSLHPSLLAARVRALLTQPSSYGWCKKTALTVLSGGVLTISALLVPKVFISADRVTAFDSARNQVLPQSKRMIAAVKRVHLPKSRKGDAFVLPVAAFASSHTPPSLDFPVALPIFASTNTAYPLSDASVSESLENTESREELQPVGKIWDESLPQAPRRRASKIGAVTWRVVKFGIGVASQIGEHEHEKGH